MSQSGLLKIDDHILPPDVPLFFEGNSGIGSAVANIFEIIGAGGATTSVVGNVMTITVASTAMTWSTVTDSSPPNPISLANNNGYISSGTNQVTFILPVSASVGDTYIITGSTSLFQVTQNAAQQIFFGSRSTTVGAFGSIASLQASDHIEILCIIANTTFKIIDSIGNLTVI